MCRKIRCSSCNKFTWFGCGRHIDQALNGVKEADRCLGWRTGKCQTVFSDCVSSSGTVGTATETETKIEVICAGLGRTGTKSLQAGLDLLNYKTYHFVSPKDAAGWASLAEGTGATSGDVLDAITAAGYNATCDNPCCDLYLEQLQKFPDAQVILTVRDTPEKWVSSWKILMEFIRVQELPFSLLYPSFIQFIPFMKNWNTMRSLMGTRVTGLDKGDLIRGWRHKEDPDAWLATQYNAHNTKVIATVPRNKLLIFNVNQGWAPLCKFLGKPVPDDPFPNVNESGDIASATIVMKVVTYAWIPIVASIAALMRSHILSNSKA